jgi:hypothetical protein
MNYWEQMLALEKKFEGVTKPQDMGTTGLCAWVAVSSGIRLYIRFRTACKIIRERVGRKAVQGFVRAVVKECLTADRKENIQRYARKIA